ncbi:MAG: cysteine--tRNA ligase, partial [Bifidobacteriaceae bacterium]|nr:cysteine--tRNA ligase [Bifidobacteriaceae bacterium]
HAGQVGIYLCGATVQASPHVGHLRPAVAFDILRRWLERRGLQVTLIRNVTDIDDKILAKAKAAGRPWWAHAQAFEREFTAAYDALGVIPPTYEPHATAHVTDMVALMRRLIDRGHAYQGRPGNVYFSVTSFPEYGALTHQGVDQLKSTEEVAPGQAESGEDDKRDPRDFALWKAPKPGEPATAAWPTPWGVGRPGWHLECSAMAWRYLGETFDIHGGGIDLRFPHHENEQAQSRAAGFGFARYWVHNAWITQAGVKMSKSLGNTLSAAALLAQYPPAVVRYALASGHYRSMMEFSDVTLKEAATAWERLSGFVQRAGERVGQPSAERVAAVPVPDAGAADAGASGSAVGFPPEFVAAMDDDLGVPAALAQVFEAMRRGNTALAAGDDQATETALLQVRAMLDVLGLDPAGDRWGGAAGGGRERAALDALVTGALERRQAARAAKDFGEADRIRDELQAAGVQVEDSPDGPRWSL